MKRWEGRTNEPLHWAMFGAGGMVAVITMPVLIVVFGLLVPYGVLDGTDDAYGRVIAVVGNPIGLVLVVAAMGLVLWHCCHRVYHGLHDLRLQPPEIIRAGIYGVALLAPVITLSLALAA